jgi:rhombotarget A family protien
MSVPQSRLLLCLLTSSLLATTSLADTVVVNTTVDENNVDNQSCSLRESLHYLNAKNVKKATNNEELAVISGVSTILADQLANANIQLAQEKDKPSPDQAKIATLETQIAQLTQKIDAGISGLNRKLNEANDALDKEKSKVSPDPVLIAGYEATIKQLELDIKNKENERTAKEKEMQDYRNKGLFGCISKDDSSNDIVALDQVASPYVLNTPLTINLALSIAPNTAPDDNNLLDGTTGLESLEGGGTDETPRVVIKAGTNNALFIIDDGVANDHDSDTSTPQKRIIVSITDVDLIGCGQNCANNGGILLNKEDLSITNVILSKGYANLGGAIFNAADAILTLRSSLLKDNQAQDGAAVYAEYTSFSILGSLFTGNKALNTSKGIITAASDSVSFLSGVLRPYVENSTFSGNTGTALLLNGNLVINNATIVNNTVGIDLNNHLPTIYNSIIAGNSSADCQAFAPIPVDTKVYFANNLSVINKGCPTASLNNHNITISNTGNQTLLAPLDANDRCAAPPANGLLCPLAENGGLTKTHKPRILASYTQLSESLLVNKGFSRDVNDKGLVCSSTDQRGMSRDNNENRCDIGAVEVQSGLRSSTQGDDIVFGQLKRFNPLDNLGDGELLPASQCAAVLGVGDYLNGCIRLSSLPRFGSATFDPLTSDILYSTTNREFHGFDKFSYTVVTTLSRFSDAINDRTLTTQVRVVSEPPGSPPSKSLDSGAMGFYSLFMLSLLMLWRRIR